MRFMYLYIALFFAGFKGQAQPTFPIEHVLVATNSDRFVVGETIYLKVYALDMDNNLSDFSKVAYIQLVSEKGESVMEMKIPLESGQGHNSFYIPSSYKTGNYSLIAYTKWMRNFGHQRFCRKELTIVNPYEIPQSTSGRKDQNSEKTTDQVITTTTDIAIELDKESYGKRDVVEVNLDLPSNTKTVHLSVTKKDVIVRKVMSGKSFNPETLSEIRWLPDYRGYTLSGTLLVNDEAKSNEIVYLSSPSRDFFMSTSMTDDRGKFYFITNELVGEHDIVLTVNLPEDNVDFQLDSDFETELGDFLPSAILLDSSMSEWIREKSIHTQIENAYYTSKRIVLTSPSVKRFYGKADRSYNLDDYTRFVLMEEVIREYVGSVFLRKEEGQFTFKVRNFSDQLRIFNENPFLMIDGVPMFTTADVINLDPKDIKAIELVARRYFYGPLDCKGIMSFQTYDGDLKGYELKPGSKRMKFQGLEPLKIPWSPDYENKADELVRIPDYRTQLYWEPIISITEGQSHRFSFFTSDVPGQYEIVVHAVDSGGKLYTSSELIEVTK